MSMPLTAIRESDFYPTKGLTAFHQHWVLQEVQDMQSLEWWMLPPCQHWLHQHHWEILQLCLGSFMMHQF